MQTVRTFRNEMRSPGVEEVCFGGDGVTFVAPFPVNSNSSSNYEIKCLSDLRILQEEIEQRHLGPRVKRRDFVIFEKPKKKEKIDVDMFCPPSSGLSAFSFMNFMMGTISIAASIMNNINNNNNNNNNNDNNNNNNIANVNIGNNNNNGNNINMVTLAPGMGRRRRRRRRRSNRFETGSSWIQTLSRERILELCEQHNAGKTDLSLVAMSGIEVYASLVSMGDTVSEAGKCKYVDSVLKKNLTKDPFRRTLFATIAKGAVKSLGLSC